MYLSRWTAVCRIRTLHCYTAIKSGLPLSHSLYLDLVTKEVSCRIPQRCPPLPPFDLRGHSGIDIFHYWLFGRFLQPIPELGGGGAVIVTESNINPVLNLSSVHGTVCTPQGCLVNRSQCTAMVGAVITQPSVKGHWAGIWVSVG